MYPKMSKKIYKQFLKKLKDDSDNIFIQIYKKRNWRYTNWLPNDNGKFTNFLTPHSYFFEDEENYIINGPVVNSRVGRIVKVIKPTIGELE